jgi:hypothetical protein
MLLNRDAGRKGCFWPMPPITLLNSGEIKRTGLLPKRYSLLRRNAITGRLSFERKMLVIFSSTNAETGSQ